MSRLLKHINVFNFEVFFLLTTQCIILEVELFICALYRLSLTNTFILNCSTGFAGEEEAVFGYFTRAEGGGGHE